MLAHAGQPLAPHDLVGAWDMNPVLLGGLVVGAWAYWRGTRSRLPNPNQAWRARCFAAALVAIAVALVSPLDALSGALASAHMVQHVLLMLVAAPLLALSSPLATLLRGSPAVIRTATVRWRRRLGLSRGRLRFAHQPVGVWLLHVGTLWFWHASVPYDAAVKHHALHVLEHAGFLVTGVLFWRLVVGARTADRVPYGLGLMLVFAMALQSVFLSALLTFARTPWYSSYATSTAAWSLDRLADQQLAGVIMWIPAGLVYVGGGLALFVSWIRTSEAPEVAV